MAAPQLENGFLRLSNELAEALARVPISGSQFRIVLVVMRECYGVNGGRKLAPLSIERIARATGLGLRMARRELRRLIETRVIVRDGTPGQRCSYGLQKDFEQWQPSQPRSNPTQVEIDLGQYRPGNPGLNRPRNPGLNRPGKSNIGKKEEKSYAFVGKYLRLTSTQIEAFGTAFPQLGLDGEFRKADAWCIANPERAPRKQHARFMNSWLGRARPTDNGHRREHTLTVGELERMRQANERTAQES